MTPSRTSLIAAVWLTVLSITSAGAQTGGTLADRIQAIMDRPEFRHSHFGIAFLDLATGEPVYQHNPDKLFTPASTTKLVTEGALLQLLGADHRFRTAIYRTGPIRDGAVDGDLVLVASGDPNLSGRIQPGGTLAFENNDHAYGGPALPGDPLLVVRDLAKQVRERGITRILGAVRVDASLFPEGDRELGSFVVISPIAVNDNLIDVSIAPGGSLGDPAHVTRDPVTSYVRFINQATTGSDDAPASIDYSSDEEGPNGTRVVTLSGTVPLSGDPVRLPYKVPVPSRYAEVVLTEALRTLGVHVDLDMASEPSDPSVLSAHYRAETMVAEHVSAPLREEVKVTLKVSQNLHASMVPHLLAAILSPNDEERTGFDEIHDFLAQAGLDLNGARQADGAGGDAHFSPHFMASFLAYMSEQESFEAFRHALPILGRDGTLWDIQPDSPAAGHVFAKTGTYGLFDPLNRRAFMTAKGLAGYVRTARGEHLAFAAYVNNVPLAAFDQITPVLGQALGEIAAAAYDARW